MKKAVKNPTPLHRYVEKVADWIVHAARHIVKLHNGQTESLWNDRPTAVTLQDRLQKFPGIGQKKAAMAVELLEKYFRVPIIGMHGSDIAYDRHIRRVLLRTCLVERDNLQHMLEITRAAYPQRPGALG